MKTLLTCLHGTEQRSPQSLAPAIAVFALCLMTSTFSHGESKTPKPWWDDFPIIIETADLDKVSLNFVALYASVALGDSAGETHANPNGVYCSSGSTP